MSCFPNVVGHMSHDKCRMNVLPIKSFTLGSLSRSELFHNDDGFNRVEQGHSIDLEIFHFLSQKQLFSLEDRTVSI